jgi:transcriptional regulator with XRE-family HTH domain
MNVRALRNEKNWSQEQLAHFSGLSIRTIQRIENNEKVGLESLKSLAAVFEIDLTPLTQIKQDIDMPITNDTLATEQAESNVSISPENMEKANQHIAEIKSFYKTVGIYIFCFLIWPFLAIIDEADNNDMWWLTLYMGGIYVFLIALHANKVFQPFGAKWQKKQQQKYFDEKH